MFESTGSELLYYHQVSNLIVMLYSDHEAVASLCFALLPELVKKENYIEV